MRLTCLGCGHQVELAEGPGDMSVSCACGADYSDPHIVNTGSQPSEWAAERSRYKAFRAAGVVKNVGGFALGISLLGVLFFPLGLVGAALGIYMLTMLRGPIGRYSGRRSAIVAVALGVVVFAVEGRLALSWYEQRRLQRLATVQEGAIEDLKRLLRAQRLFRATSERYGTFESFKFKRARGMYTIYLGPFDISPATRDGRKITDPLPPDLPPELSPGVGADNFTAVAVANLDADEALDVWVMTARTHPKHVADDIGVGLADTPSEEDAGFDGVVHDDAFELKPVDEFPDECDKGEGEACAAEEGMPEAPGAPAPEKPPPSADPSGESGQDDAE